MNRRQLLGITAAAAPRVSGRCHRTRARRHHSRGHRTPEEVATDEDFWAEVRAAFSIDRNMINFNNGYVSPSPRPVQDAMRR